MKTIVAVLAILIASCKDDEISFLEGTWQSNKELTIAHFTNNAALTQKRKDFLHKHLGELSIVFKGSKTGIHFEKPEVFEWYSFKIIKQTPSSFTISESYSLVESNEITYKWAGKCFYLENKEYGYDEYFCKVPG